MHMIWALTPLLALALPTASLAETYRLESATPDVAQAVLKSTVASEEDGVRRFVLMTSFSAPQRLSDKLSYDYSLATYRYRCQDRSYRLGPTALYTRSGVLIGRTDGNSQALPVAGGSVLEHSLNAFCANTAEEVFDSPSPALAAQRLRPAPSHDVVG